MSSKVKNKDLTGKRCSSCKKGSYKETSINDDKDGVLHCDNCNLKVSRWNSLPDGKKEF